MKPFHAFGSVPLSVPPTQEVIYWHEALFFALVGFAVALPFSTFLATLATDARFVDVLYGVWVGFWRALSFGHSFEDDWWTFTATQGVRAYLLTFWVWFMTLCVAGVMGWLGATPRNNIVHIQGPRLLRDKEAQKEAKRLSLPLKDQATDRFCMRLHPLLMLPKKTWSRHVLIGGSVGSGKTVILSTIIDELIRTQSKIFLYDVKGDFTTRYKDMSIVSPFDGRSRVWDVAKDITSPTQASAFASSLIPEEQGSNNFFNKSAQQILLGSVRYLQTHHPGEWTWEQLARTVNRKAVDMLPMLLESYPKAAQLISDPESQTTASILSTLAAYTRVIDDLALAWPDTDYENPKKKRFSITQWVTDQDTTNPKHIIVQAGKDPTLTKAYIAAMINVAVPEIISATLPDNESGRSLAFVLDELSSIGRISIGPLIDKGRSKGVVFVGAYQDLAQLQDIYGPNETKALSSMVGMTIVCQIGMGETRKQLSDQFDRRLVAVMDRKDGKASEVSRPVVLPNEFTTDLGFRKGKDMGPEGWGIKALVQLGGNPMILDFPGKTYPKHRQGQMPARWTTGPARSIQEPMRQAFNRKVEVSNHETEPLYRRSAEILALDEEQTEELLDSLKLPTLPNALTQRFDEHAIRKGPVLSRA